MPNALADQFRNVYNAMIPGMARLYSGFMLGRTAPITERDFTPETLDFLRKQTETQRVKDMAQMAQMRALLDETPEEYAKNPLVDPINAKTGFGGGMPYEKAVAYAREQLAGYNPKHVAITKYEDEVANADTNNSILLDPYNPRTNAGLMVGRYNVYNTPEGEYLMDRYDFDNTPGNSLMSEGIVAKLNALANLVHPGKSIPVKVKLNGRK